MEIAARLSKGESLGDRILKVNHAGEHGAVNIYRGQVLASRFRTPSLVAALREFQQHEERHRSTFWAELQRRGKPRCARLSRPSFGRSGNITTKPTST